MPRLYKQKNFNIKGKVLSKKDFRPWRDVKEVSFNPERTKAIIECADAMLDEPLHVIPLSLWREFETSGDRAKFQKVYFRRRAMLVNLAVAELVTKTGKYTEKLVDVIFAILEESTWVIPAHDYCNINYSKLGAPGIFGDRMHGIDLYSAATAASLAYVYYALADTLDGYTPVLRERMAYEIDQRTAIPFSVLTFGWTGQRGNRPNNWCPWICSNVLFATALVTEDPKVRECVVSRAMSFVDNFISFYKDDGGCDEGPSYWGGAGGSYFDCLELIYDLTDGYVDIFGHPLLRAIGEYEVKFNINRTRFINFADCPPSINPGGAFLRRFGERIGSAAMCNFGDSLELVGMTEGVAFPHLYRNLRNLMAPTVTEAHHQTIKKVWFPDLKVMAKRECDDTSVGFFVAMKGGHNAESHNHNDVGSVVVYYNGNPVLIDTGSGAYTKKSFGPYRYEQWWVQSRYHNVADIGGLAQVNGAQFRSTDEVYDEECGSVSMELREAYPAECGIRSYRRKTSLENGVVTISDSFDFEKPTEVDIHFITHVRPAQNEDGSLTLVEGRTITPVGDCVREVEEYEVAEANIERNWGSPTLFRIHYRLTVQKGSISFEIR